MVREEKVAAQAAIKHCLLPDGNCLVTEGYLKILNDHELAQAIQLRLNLALRCVGDSGLT
jgi:hypothetical protein